MSKTNKERKDEIKIFDSKTNKILNWDKIQNTISNKFNKRIKTKRVDSRIKENKDFNDLIHSDNSVFFTRAETLVESINKNIDFINLKIYIKDKDVFKNDRFWLKKAIKWTKAKEVESAIDFYKQALHTNHSNYTAAFNLACEYEKQCSLSLGIKWFEYWIKLQPHEPMPYWGKALCKFKQGKFVDSLEAITLSISLEQKIKPDALSCGKIDHPELWYIKALCCSRLRLYEQAQKEYSILLPYIK